MDALIHINFEASEDWLNDNLIQLSQLIKGWIKKGLDNSAEIDFVDMLLFPVAKKYPLEYHTHVLIDECQDLSPLMHQFVKYYRSKSRIIAVGDRMQAINAFAGAASDSFDRLIELTEAKELPLSICYRCPDEVIEMAKKYVPEIEGTGKTGTIENNLDYTDVVENLALPGDLILCRRNAPLLKMAFSFYAQTKKCVIKGNGFSDYLKSLVMKVKKIDKNFDRFIENLMSYVNERIEKMRNEDKIQLYLDASECLTILYEESNPNSFADLTKTIDNLFTNNEGNEDERTITLSSFHRSKGLENERVFILLDKPLTSPGNDQESNLSYVAITRTTNYLGFIRTKK